MTSYEQMKEKVINTYKHPHMYMYCTFIILVQLYNYMYMYTVKLSNKGHFVTNIKV